MNHDYSKLRHREEQELAAEQNTASTPREKQFSSVEELLRYDSEQNPVPPGVAERVNDSIKQEPPPEKSWWQRFFKS